MALVDENITEVKNKEEEITVLYDKVKKNKTQVHEILPDWLLTAVKVNDSFENSKKISKVSEISPEMKTVLKKGFKKLFPVQHSVIPAIINSNKTNNIFRPHDICVCAPTGSGKTLAYVIPILQLLSEDSKVADGPRALIVLPVRDLASQVYNVFNGLSKSLGIRCCLLTGQKNLADERKDLFEDVESSRNKIDIIVCTPGRLVDHIRNTKGLDLSYLRFLVIDEADRVLEEHKHDWFLATSRAIDASRGVIDSRKHKNILSCFVIDDRPILQKILLSATLTREPHLLEHFDLHYPLLYVVGGDTAPGSGPVQVEADLADNYAAPATLTDHYVVCSKDYSKVLFLVDQVRRLKQTRILCFTNTRDSADRLHRLLSEFAGVRSASLSCQLHPKARRKVLAEFEAGGTDVLVTVDSMGRGMDIEGVRAVVQYDLPATVHTHIHRVGRTARGGQPGVAFALCTDKQVFHLRRGLAACNRRIRQLRFPEGRCYRYLDEYNGALARLRSAPPVSAPPEDVRMQE